MKLNIYLCYTVDIPSIGHIVVNKICATSLSISWDTHVHPGCGVLSQSVTISSSSSSITYRFSASNNNFTFNNLNSNTSYDVTVDLRYSKHRFTARQTTIKTSPSYRMCLVLYIACITCMCTMYSICMCRTLYLPHSSSSCC